MPRSIILVTAGIVLLWNVSLLSDAPAPVDDFIEYWSASRLLLAGKNPYSTDELTLLQRPFTGSETPLIMWNPPWALGLLLPFGLLEYSASRWLWLALNLGLLFFSARWLWIQHIPREGLSRLAPGAILILTVTFLPGVIVLSLGQIGPVILAGIVGFLWMVQRKRYFGAGVITLLVALKPHLLFLFWIVLLLWVVRTRRWVLVAGLSSALAVGLCLPLLFYRDLVAGYFNLVARESIFHHPSTTIGAFLRWMIGWEKSWLQMLPMGAGVFWAGLYWTRHGKSWEWSARIPLVLLVSVVTSCYGWIFDQVVLYPALFQAAGWFLGKGQGRERLLAAVYYLLINAAGVVLIVLGFNGIAYVWMAPAWIVFHSIAARLPARSVTCVQPAATL